MPEFMLKRMILANFPTKQMEAEIANSVDFMVEQLETLSQSELAGRLTLNCTVATWLKPAELPIEKSKLTVLDCLDEVAIPDKMREEVYKLFPDAKIAELRTGGNFPFLSRGDEVNVYIQVHMRNHGIDPAKTNQKGLQKDEEDQENTENKSEEIKSAKEEENKPGKQEIQDTERSQE